MSLHALFTKHIYWPFTQKIKNEYTALAFKELNESQWKSQDELLSIQWKGVLRTVNKATQEIPYYQKKCREVGWESKKSNFSYEDFLNFPVLQKKTLRDNISDFLNPNYKGRVTLGRTSGSTGESLTLYYNSEHESFSDAGRWRAKSWWGVEPGSPHVSIWGRPFTGYRYFFSSKIKSYFMNTLLFSAFELNDKALENIWKKISRFKPEIIYGYPTAIFPLSVYVNENKKRVDHLNLKVIMITAETITSEQRKLIEEVFNCKTANEYGCSETGGFVYECPHKGWHISSEHAFLEFLDKKGQPVTQGQGGDIYITHITNDYMPLIRYKVGDMGASLPGVCSCGRGLPLMNVSVTKESDIFTLSNRNTYSSEIFDYINLAVSKTYPGAILQFRVVQKGADNFHVEFIGGSNQWERGKNLFKKKMKEELGEEVEVDFNKVSEIMREPSGKLRYFVSEIN
jgi:phenylacetate-CoA ligase